MASGHLTHPSWDSDSKRGTTDGTMRNKYDQARAQDMPASEWQETRNKAEASVEAVQIAAQLRQL